MCGAAYNGGGNEKSAVLNWSGHITQRGGVWKAALHSWPSQQAHLSVCTVELPGRLCLLSSLAVLESLCYPARVRLSCASAARLLQTLRSSWPDCCPLGRPGSVTLQRCSNIVQEGDCRCALEQRVKSFGYCSMFQGDQSRCDNGNPSSAICSLCAYDVGGEATGHQHTCFHRMTGRQSVGVAASGSQFLVGSKACGAAGGHRCVAGIQAWQLALALPGRGSSCIAYEVSIAALHVGSHYNAGSLFALNHLKSKGIPQRFSCSSRRAHVLEQEPACVQGLHPQATRVSPVGGRLLPQACYAPSALA